MARKKAKPKPPRKTIKKNKPLPRATKRAGSPAKQKSVKKTIATQAPTTAKIVQLESLRDRLREAEETLAAIRNGEVDSLVVAGPDGEQVFSLKGADQPYRVFVEKMQDGAATVSHDGTILFSNKRFAEMVGRPMERVTGSSIFSYFSNAENTTTVRRILRNSEGKKARLSLTSAASGRTIPVQFSFSQLNLDEKLSAACIVVTDLTGEEENIELKTALHKIETTQAEMSAQHEELVRARAVAEEANSAKDNFLAALSHELRTPLTPVLLSLSSLENDLKLSDSTREELGLLRRNVELEVQLIDDLLDLTRIVRGKIELNRKVIDVHVALKGALGICSSLISTKQLHFSQSLRADAPFIRGDPIRIQQILWNVLRNAVKFTPEGGRIAIHSSNVGGKLLISVIDTGIGIESNAYERIFNPFEQANRLITRQFGGLGLGLAISRRLAELHGGTIRVESEGQDNGSTFTIEFPAVAAPTHTSDVPPAEASRSSRKLHILLVEDHDDTRRSMLRLLQPDHFVVDAATMGEALEAASKNSFDLVISDLGLPDGSGLDLMTTLRDTYHLKGICLTGFGMDEDVQMATRAGFEYHLTKPISMNRLREAIEQLDALATAPSDH